MVDYQTLGNYDKFLKEWYLSSWIDQLNSMTTTWKLFRRKLVDYKGRQMVIPIRTSRNTGVGAIPLSGGSNAAPTLISAGRQGIENATISSKIVQGAIEISQDAIDQSASDRGAFYEVVDFEMRGLVQDLAEDLDRQMYGSGNGFLADATVVAGTTFTVSNHFPFYPNQLLNAWTDNSATATQRTTDGSNTTFTVSSVTRNSDGSGDVVVDANHDVDADDVLVRSGVRTQTAGYEMMGIDGIVDTANPSLESGFEGIDRTAAANAYWQATVNTLAPDDMTEGIIQTAFDNVHDNSNGDVNVLLMHRKLRGELYNNMAVANNTRLVDTNVVQPGYLSGKLEDHHPDAHDFLFWDGRVPIIVDKFCPIDIDGGVATGTCYGLNLDSIFMALITDFKWWSPEGQILHRSESRKFAVTADMYIYGNLACDAPNKNFKITGANLD